jgi:hypothetical protein
MGAPPCQPGTAWAAPDMEFDAQQSGGPPRPPLWRFEAYNGSTRRAGLAGNGAEPVDSPSRGEAVMAANLYHLHTQKVARPSPTSRFPRWPPDGLALFVAACASGS